MCWSTLLNVVSFFRVSVENFGYFPRLVSLGLFLTLTACAGGREKMAGPNVKITPLATINVVSTAPVIEVHDVASRDQTVRVLVENVADTSGIVILFAGGSGVTKISDQGRIGRLAGNFLIRSRNFFWRHNIMTVVFDSPSDMTEDLRPYHDEPTFAGDVGALIHHLRRTYGLPVWVVGTSRGTVATANAASRQKKNSPDGAVFTSSLFEGKRSADVFDLPLENVQIPSLIVHHELDGCQYTSPYDVLKFKTRLTKARTVKVIWFNRGSNRGDPCQAGGFHGFKGIEELVIGEISKWIKMPVN